MGRPDEPTVSVILPTYNRMSSLGAAIVSVLTQSYVDLELIVIDDGSSENIASVVDGFADPRVRYVRREANGGAAAARNTGLAHARGRFIAFQDSDDIWLPAKLARQMALLEAAPRTVGVVTGAKIVYGRDDSFVYGPSKVALAPTPAGRLRPDEDQFDHLLRENRLSVQNALFRRDCHPGSKWFDECAKANEDWEFAIRLATRTTIQEDREPVVVGFVSSDSISSNFRKQTIGVLRILKRNREALSHKRNRRSQLLIDVARSLFAARRYRSARRFLLAGLKDRPTAAAALALALIKRILAKLAARPHSKPAAHPAPERRHSKIKLGGLVRSRPTR